MTITREETDVTAFEYRLAKLGAGFSSGERPNERKAIITLCDDGHMVDLLVITYRVGIGDRVEHVRFEERELGVIAHAQAQEPTIHRNRSEPRFTETLISAKCPQSVAQDKSVSDCAKSAWIREFLSENG